MSAYLCDVNVWLALAVSGHFHEVPVREWFESVSERGSVRFCRSTQQSLLRLLTTPAIIARYGLSAVTNEQAWSTFDALTADRRVSFISEDPVALEGTWRRFSTRPSASAKLWMDAYLAAFAVAAKLTLVTTDTGFRQFEGLDVLILRAPSASP